ncbi:MAG: phosphotransferase, partial [Candidatus Dormibacteraceae bacterium]
WEPAEVRFADTAAAGLRTLRSEDWVLAAAIEAATAAAEAAQQEVGTDRLPRFMLHGDFTAINVLQRRSVPAAVIDFDLSHIGTRPWEFAIARLYKALEMLEGYREEAARIGIALTDEELRAIPTVYRGFRAGMIRWQLIDHGLTGRPLNVPFIRRQLDLLRTPHLPAA